MKVLAIESSAIAASIAVIVDNNLVCEYTLNNKKTHSQTLMPMIEEAMKNSEVDISDIDLIAVSKGPGSFTGLRIGVATAKGLAHALNIPVIGVETLKALSYNISANNMLICPLMDARRSRVYTAIYEYNENNKLNEIVASTVLPIEELLSNIKEYNKKIIFLGDGVNTYIDIIKNNLSQDKYVIASLNNNVPRAASVAVCGFECANQSKIENYQDLKPIYLRKSQAEQQLERKAKCSLQEK